MKNFIEMLVGNLDNKKEYYKYKERINKLPKDYRKAIKGVEEYMNHFWNGKGNYMKMFYDLLEMFEGSAADGKKAKDVIGNDLGAFCDNLLNAVTEEKK